MALVIWSSLVCALAIGAPPRPNIVFILADDLGYGELGCYGQTKIKTPNIDRLAAEGVRFTQHYSGSPVCAPSRCALLTGRSPGHMAIRDNLEKGGWGPNEPEGQLPLPAGTPTVARYLKSKGYATGVFGKWGLGGPGSVGAPNAQGFDEFVGILCQRVAHNHYPTHLWHNADVLPLNNAYFSAHQKNTQAPTDPNADDAYRGKQYASDVITDHALQFVRSNAKKPFFMYLAYPIPHAALQVPKDSLTPYLGQFEDKPYLGNQSYLPNMTPRATYAAMISRMDGYVGKLMKTLKETGADENTLVIFSSDNGATFNGGVDRDFFKSNGDLRGMKTQLWEGGIRVPLVARWPRHISKGVASDRISAFWDFAPTVFEIAGGGGFRSEGTSYLSALMGSRVRQAQRPLYFEFPSFIGGGQAVRWGKWKAVRVQAVKNPEGPIQLYDLDADPKESKDVARDHPDVVAKMVELMEKSREPSFVKRWNYKKSER